MIGKVVQARSGFPIFAVLFLLLGLGLALAGLYLHEANLGLASLLPVALALPSWLSRNAGWTVEFGEHSFTVSEGGRTIPYDSLHALTPAQGFTNRKLLSEASGAFHVFHREGVVRVPARLDAPTHEVYGFILDLMASSGSRDVPAELMPYLQKQVASFGEERVWSFVERSHTRRPSAYLAVRWHALTLLLCGIAWITAGVQSKPLEGWIAGGIIAILISVVLLLVPLVSTLPKMKKSRSGGRAGLVISPLGLALVQGDIHGEMRWDELRGLTLGVTPAWTHWGRTGHAHALLLRVEGAEILIWDI